jgi:hypothetical protein
MNTLNLLYTKNFIFSNTVSYIISVLQKFHLAFSIEVVPMFLQLKVQLYFIKTTVGTMLKASTMELEEAAVAT